MGNPRQKTVHSWEEFLDYINTYNGFSRVFCALYQLETNRYVDKLWFDFDGLEHKEKTRYWHKTLTEKDILHSIVMSGYGFHLYIFNKPFYTSNQDEFGAVKNAAIKEFHLEGFGEESVRDMGRVVGVPGTYNTKRKYFVTSLTTEDLNLETEQLLQKCTVPNPHLYIYGNKLLDVNIEKTARLEQIQTVDVKIVNKPDEVIKKALEILPRHKNKFEFRYSLILYMLENLYTLEQIHEMIEKADPSRDHSTFKDRVNQSKDIFKKRFDYFVSTDFFREVGVKCKDD